MEVQSTLLLHKHSHCSSKGDGTGAATARHTGGMGLQSRDHTRNTPMCTMCLPWRAARVSSGFFVFLACRHKFEFLHSGMTPDIRITVPPRRIGILLDYENCRLSFFNADLAQHLYTFNSCFQHYVHPCFALETPAILRIHTGIATPLWTVLP